VFEKNPSTVKVVYKNFPLRSHKYAITAAVAALAAGRQGKFWEFHDELYKIYKQINDQKILEIAQKLRYQRSGNSTDDSARLSRGCAKRG
jgi:protein-disulfide isomerase